MTTSIDVRVARLDGYLSGIASLNGKIRDYSSFSYLINQVNPDEPLEDAVKRHFLPHANFEFSNVECLSKGLRALETEIRPLLIREATETLFETVDFLDERRKYLAFRVMDFISEIIGDDYNSKDVFRLEGQCKESISRCIFFGLRVEKCILILQFNSDF